MSVHKTYRVRNIIWLSLFLELTFFGLGILGYNWITKTNPEFRLEHSHWLYTLIALPIITICYISYYAWKNRAIKRFADQRLLPYLLPIPNNLNIFWRYIFMRLGLGLTLFSLCNPQFSQSKKVGIAKGIDIIIALDISKSMETKDLSKLHSRLDIAKRSITRLLKEGLSSDRVGLVVFAGNAYKQVALSRDYDALIFDLGNVNTNMLSIQGTNLSAAIDLSLTSFSSKDKTNKAIILVSDGENHEPNAIQSAKKALTDHNVKVYSIGMGTPEGARIPKYDDNGELLGYLRNNRGNTVLSKLNEEMLKSIAESGKGLYHKASNTNLGLEEIIEDINTIEKTEFGKNDYKNYDSQFQWFLAPGIVLMILSLLLYNDQLKRTQRLNLFA